jgi:hypothetical protein
MSAVDLALIHVAHGITYSWDLTTLISLGVPISLQLRQKLLAGATTKEDAELLRALLRDKTRARSDA